MQSYEIKELRRENEKLKEQLRDARAERSVDDEDDDAKSPDRLSAWESARATAKTQRCFRTNERVNNIYFGTPGLANIVFDVSIFGLLRTSDLLTVQCSLQISKLAAPL